MIWNCVVEWENRLLSFVLFHITEVPKFLHSKIPWTSIKQRYFLRESADLSIAYPRILQGSSDRKLGDVAKEDSCVTEHITLSGYITTTNWWFRHVAYSEIRWERFSSFTIITMLCPLFCHCDRFRLYGHIHFNSFISLNNVKLMSNLGYKTVRSKLIKVF